MSDDHLAVLTQDVRRFLKETNYDNCEVFLATPSKDIAQKYIKWRVENNKPALRQDPVNVVYAWKQEVTRKQRDSKASAGSKAQAVLHVQSVGVPKSSPPPVKMVVTNKSPPPPPRPSRLSRRHKPINPKTAPGPDHAKEVRQRFGAPQMVKVPGVNDVLAGRGGLTNQHPGNEWFRRLVRCSRGFYKSCPKHTKMSVAKAIVRSVHLKYPPGRFLELVQGPAGEMLWRECEYKKSVDKASQALREKWEQSTDDEVLQSSMQLMFDKKLDSEGGLDRAARESVEEAVYFAVTTVALEYAKRWGTPSFRSLSDALRPIVASSSSPKESKKGTARTRTLTANKATTKAVVTGVNVDEPTPPPVANFRAEMPTSAKMTPSEVALARNYAAAMAAATTPPPLARAASAPRAVKPISLPRRAVSSPPMKLYNPTGHKKHNLELGGALGSPIRKLNTPPPRTGKPLPFSSQAPAQTNRVSAPTSPDTFGAPAPPEIVVASSKKMDISEESSSLSPMRSKAYKEVVKANVSDGSESSILGRTVSLVSPTPGENKVAAARRLRSPSKSSPSSSPVYAAGPKKAASTGNKNQSVGAKRKLSNIVTIKEIEEDIKKRPKNHGMSPFHQELLKMNLTAIVDW